MDTVNQPISAAEATPDGATQLTLSDPLPTRSAADRLKNAWAAARAAVGGLLGLAPHVMHHIGIVAGTALLAGFWGNAVLYVLGLLLSIPMFKRLHRRYGSIAAPVIGAAVFTVLFLFSALVLGPAINPTGSAPAAPVASAPGDPGSEHASHHA